MEPEVTDATDRAQHREADISVRHREAQERADIAEVLGTAPGRRVLYRLLEDCGLLKTVFDTDALRMAFMSGRQDIGHRWSARIEEVRPGALFHLMETVAQEREKQDRDKRARRTKRDEES